MIFKQDWEKTQSSIVVSYGIIEGMVNCAFPQKKLASQEMISGGCANLNIKINFETDNKSFLLRIYLRDPKAKYREQRIGELLYRRIPVPRTHYSGIYNEYDFAITEFMSGITLRDFLLSQHSFNFENIMFEVGCILEKIISSDSLTRIPLKSKEDLWIFIQHCLHHPTLKLHLNSKIIQKLNDCFEQYQPILLNLTDHRLVHGDFDPANILVKKNRGIWQVSAILDWEFAFAGSMMWDVANMLRYAHLMPSSFAFPFIQGIESQGIKLPQDWQIIVYLLNLVSLIELSTRADPNQRPQQWADICSLRDYFLTRLLK